MEEKWDTVKADDTLTQIEKSLDSLFGVGQTIARIRVTEIYRDLAREYHNGRDPKLFEVPAILHRLQREWRAPPRPGPEFAVRPEGASPDWTPWEEEG